MKLFGTASSIIIIPYASTIWAPFAVKSERSTRKLSSHWASARVLESWRAAELVEDILVLGEGVVSCRVPSTVNGAGASERKTGVSVDGEIVSTRCLCLVDGRELLPTSFN